jgi:hypothetical protein
MVAIENLQDETGAKLRSEEIEKKGRSVPSQKEGLQDIGSADEGKP